MSVVKNWFNQDSHPTDEYIHWKESYDPKFKQTVATLREAYDLLAELDRAKLELLLERAYRAGRLDESEMGEDF